MATCSEGWHAKGSSGEFQHARHQRGGGRDSEYVWGGGGGYGASIWGKYHQQLGVPYTGDRKKTLRACLHTVHCTTCNVASTRGF